MHRKSVLLMPIGLFLAACTNLPDTRGPLAVAGDVPIRMPECGNSAAGPKIIVIQAKKEEFGVKPPRFCVGRDPANDIDITVRVVGPPGNHPAGSVRIEAKSFVNDAGGWLSGSNPGGPGDDSFTITIPAGTAGTFLYDVIVDGYGTMDPIITVED